MGSKLTLMFVGDTIADHVSWTWNRAQMRYEAVINRGDDLVNLELRFHKVGGRWSKNHADGTARADADRGYWTIVVDNEHHRHAKHSSPNDAQKAAIAEYLRRFGKTRRFS